MSDSEGWLMPKRETNKQRVARESQRGAILQIARKIAGAIRTRRHAMSLSGRERDLFEYVDKVFNTANLESDTWVESESVENIANGLRLAADMLEEKPMDGRSLSGHDSKIMAAFLEASVRVRHDHPYRVKPLFEDTTSRITILPQPTFSEILKVYRQQNPRVKVEDRTLRRSLRRLGVIPHPDKRGRPKKK
jgi:hypothetical protein